MKNAQTKSNMPGTHPLHPQRLLWYMKRAHHHTLAQPHTKLIEKNRVYAGWHGKQHHGKVHMFALAMYMLVIVASVAGFSQVAHAFSSWLQTDWSAGVGTSTANQYASATNIQTDTPASLTLGATTTTSNWCDTAICDSNWTKRKSVVINNPTTASTDEQIMLYIPYDAAMNSDYSDLRFTDSSGVDLNYFIELKTDSTRASVYVKTSSLSQGYNSIYMYYGNSGASSLSDSGATLDFFEDWSSGLTNWDVISGATPADYAITPGSKFEVNRTNKTVRLETTETFPRANNSKVEIAYQSGDGSGTICTDTATSSYVGFGSNAGNQRLHVQAAGDYCPNVTVESGGTNTTYADLGAPVSTMTEAKYLKSQLISGGTASFGGSSSYQFGLAPYDTYTNDNTTDDGLSSYPVQLYVADSGNTIHDFKHVLVTHGLSTVGAYGPVEYVGGKFGTVTSAVFDVGEDHILWGVATLTTQGSNGLALVKVRAATNANMSDATDWAACRWTVDGESVSTGNTCVGGVTQRYFQYQLTMSADVGSDLEVNAVGVEYAVHDELPPSAPGTISAIAGSGGKALLNDEWTNLVNGPNVPALGATPSDPIYSWAAAVDEGSGSGVVGYCVYFGTDGSADPLTSAGLINDASALDTGGTCPYAIAVTTLDIGAITLSSPIDDQASEGPTYYLRVRALDAVYNVSAGTTAHSFKYDANAPAVFAPQVATSGVLGQAVFDISWINQVDLGGGLMSVPFDPESGLAGVKYCIASPANQAVCFGAGWYGDIGSSATDLSDPTGAASAATGLLHVDATSNPNIDPNGVNLLYVAVYDNVGNLANNASGLFNPGVVNSISLHNVAPAAPQNLQVNPSSSTTNSFSFSWDAPSDLYGQASRANYCWSVNVIPDAQHCNYAGAGVETLSADAYATQPGLNTMYVVAKDEAGNIDYAHRASVGFTANTTAPGAPRNLDVIDASNKATSSWKLALSWDVPLLSGSGVDHYSILRSEDDLTYSQIGSTTATSFVDAGLSQILYYYKVEACDNANNCSAASTSDSLLPTGRYTDPATIVAGPQVRDIKTRNATVFWSTDRFSDSKVAYGTSSGNYFPAEAYKSPQVTAHSLELSNLNPGTTYYYKTKWTDNDGNTGESAEMTFATSPAPVVSDVSVQSVNLDRANVRFTTTGATRVKVYYGTSPLFGALSAINTSTDTSTYGLDLTGLNDGTKYFYRVNTIDSSGFEYDGSVASFTTVSRPRITNVRFQTIEGEPSSTQKITWDTNVAASSELSYGPVGGKQIETVSSDAVTSHEVTIRGLQDDTQYSLVARSRDALGNVAVSDPQQFQTALDTRAPGISEVNTEASIRGTGAEARGQIIVTWKTDEPATSQVSYGSGVGANATTLSAEDSRLTTDHIVIISDLPTSSVYSIKALSKDKGANMATSAQQSVVVGRGSDNIFSIIFNALQQIFGFKL